MKHLYFFVSLLFALLAMPASQAQVAKWQPKSATVVSAASVARLGAAQRASSKDVLAQHPGLKALLDRSEKPSLLTGTAAERNVKASGARANVNFTINAYEEDGMTPAGNLIALVYGENGVGAFDMDAYGSVTIQLPTGDYNVFVFDYYEHPVLMDYVTVSRSGQSIDLTYENYRRVTVNFKNASVDGITTAGFFFANDQWASIVNQIMLQTGVAETEIIQNPLGITSDAEGSVSLLLPKGDAAYTLICDGQDNASVYPIDGYQVQTLTGDEAATLSYDFTGYQPVRFYVNGELKQTADGHYPYMNFYEQGSTELINTYATFPVILLPNGNYQAQFYFDGRADGNVLPEDSVKFTVAGEPLRGDFAYDRDNDFSLLTVEPAGDLANYTGQVIIGSAALNFSGSFQCYVKKGPNAYSIPTLSDGAGRSYDALGELQAFEATGSETTLEIQPYSTDWKALTLNHNASSSLSEEDIFYGIFHFYVNNVYAYSYYVDQQLQYGFALPYGTYQVRTVKNGQWYIAEFVVSEGSVNTANLSFAADLTGISSTTAETLSATPAATGLLVQSAAAGNISVAVYDAAGKQVAAAEALPGSVAATGELPSGVYVAVLTQGSQKATVKYVKK